MALICDSISMGTLIKESLKQAELMLGKRFVDLFKTESVSGMSVLPVFELKENYRNSQEIVQYYNTKLAAEDRAMGLKVGREVIHISVAEVETICKLCLLLKHRVVIICNSHDVLPSSLLKICIKNGIEKGKASLMSIAEVRGLEFDTAIVFENELSRNEST